MIKRWLKKWLLPDMYKQIELLLTLNKNLNSDNKGLNIENESLKDKNKKCQESINKTNSYYKGLMKSKKGNSLV